MRATPRRVLAALCSFGLVLASPALAWGAQSFKPQEEFKLDPWIEWHLGPIDMSINKAVFYLWLAAAATILTMVTAAASHR